MIIPDNIAEEKIILKDQFFDLRGLSVYSALGVSTLRDHIKKGMPCFKIGGKILVRMSEFNGWIERYRHNAERDINAMVDDVVNQSNSPKVIRTKCL